MPDKPPLHLVGQVLVKPALLRQAARILHREARQLAEAYTVPDNGAWEDQEAQHDHVRYKAIAAELEQAARGPLS